MFVGIFKTVPSILQRIRFYCSLIELQCFIVVSPHITFKYLFFKNPPIILEACLLLQSLIPLLCVINN